MTTQQKIDKKTGTTPAPVKGQAPLKPQAAAPVAPPAPSKPQAPAPVPTQTQSKVQAPAPVQPVQAKSPAKPDDLRQQIALRAYRIYLERIKMGKSGAPMDDWLRAEMELKGQPATATNKL